MASDEQHTTDSFTAVTLPSIEPEVALLLTNEETLCEKAIALLLKISSSIVQQPQEKRVRSLNLASRAVEFTLLPAIGAIELLFFMGFQEANDRLVMPEDACLETVRMYQEQLHLLFNWKTSNTNGSRTMAGQAPSISASLHSLCSNNSSPASLRSNPGGGGSQQQSPRSNCSNNQMLSGNRRTSPSRPSTASNTRTSPKLPNKVSALPPVKSTTSPSAKSTLISNTKSKALHSCSSVQASNAASKNPILKSLGNANAKTINAVQKITGKASENNANKLLQQKTSSLESGAGGKDNNSPVTNGKVSKPIASPRSNKQTLESSSLSVNNASGNKSSSPSRITTATGTISASSFTNSSGSSSSNSKIQQSPAASTCYKASTNSSSSSQSATSASTGSDVSASGSSSTPSSIVAPLVTTPANAAATAGGAAAAPSTPCGTGATNKKIAPHKLRPSIQWLSRFTGYLQRVLSYEDPVHQARARSLIPVARLHGQALVALKEDMAAAAGGANKNTTLIADAANKNAAVATIEKPSRDKVNKPFDHNDHLLVELTHWFKRDFFRWFDCGWCSECHCNMASKGSVPPTKYELEGEANRVEFYQCQTCGRERRFPRYLNVGRLLETREGRCGEWASCFTLCCRTMGFDTRQVFDETDHTWAEVWSQSQSRWVHADPCEGRVDCPLLYECGWGKKLTYVVAASRDEVMDVTWRYTLKPLDVQQRRDKVSETALYDHLWSLTVQLQQQHQQHTRNALHLRMAREIATFFAPTRTPSKDELGGRSSGSLGWRVSRGETGILKTAPHHTFTLHHTARITTLIVKYSPVRDVYWCEGVVGAAELQGWHSGVHTGANLALKREHDWHTVYLARTEGETGARMGEVVWRVHWESARVSLDSLHVVLRYTVFHSATVTWGVTVNGEHYKGDNTGELRVTNLCCKAANKASVQQLANAAAAAENVNVNVKNDAKIFSKPDSKNAGKSTRNNNSGSGGSKGKNANKNEAEQKDGKINHDSSLSPRFSLTPRNRDDSKSPARGSSKLDVEKICSSSSRPSAAYTKSQSRSLVNNRNDDSCSAATKEPTSASNKAKEREQQHDNSRSTGRDLDNNCSTGELEVRVVLEGGVGDNAWQHAQLFRLNDNDTQSVPFMIDLQFL
uniref:Peptide-N(4)-(N-acetyl-beta-glucosaminyl)asparagine amidase n=3 Tax=Hirondellea gigas TaxID=1518452 RepID=A0A6A7FUE5_9CRUS